MAEIFNQGFALVLGVGADLPNTADDAKGLANKYLDRINLIFFHRSPLPPLSPSRPPYEGGGLLE